MPKLQIDIYPPGFKSEQGTLQLKLGSVPVEPAFPSMTAVPKFLKGSFSA
jgi:hypothetical protein